MALKLLYTHTTQCLAALFFGRMLGTALGSLSDWVNIDLGQHAWMKISQSHSNFAAIAETDHLKLNLAWAPFLKFPSQGSAEFLTNWTFSTLLPRLWSCFLQTMEFRFQMDGPISTMPVICASTTSSLFFSLYDSSVWNHFQESANPFFYLLRGTLPPTAKPALPWSASWTWPPPFWTGSTSITRITSFSTRRINPAFPVNPCSPSYQPLLVGTVP